MNLCYKHEYGKKRRMNHLYLHTPTKVGSGKIRERMRVLPNTKENEQLEIKMWILSYILYHDL